MRHGSGWIYRCVRHFLSFFWVLGDADLSRSFGFFFSSEGLAETPPPPPPRVFFGDVSKLARLEKERGRKTMKAPSLAVVVVVVFSLDRKCWKMTMIITHTKTRADDYYSIALKLLSRRREIHRHRTAFADQSRRLPRETNSLAPRETPQRRRPLRRRRGLEAQRAHAGRNVLR